MIGVLATYRSEGRTTSFGGWSLVAPLLELDGFVDEVLLVQHGPAHLAVTVSALELPGRDVEELVVVALGLPVLGLRLRPEVAAAGLATVQRVDAHELTQLEEVGDAAGLLQA